MANIYDTLKKDHDTHRDLLKRIAETSGDSPTRRDLWKEYFFDVSAHAAAEEEAFYAPLMEKQDGQPEARHSVAEHKELDDIMQELQGDIEMDSSGWLTRFKTLKHDYEHHIDEEENDIFPAARKVLGDDTDGAMAEKFRQRKEKERKLVTEKADAALED